jgi:hypothetical protein
MELFARLGRITVAESALDEAVTSYAEREMRNRISDSPHGGTWHTSMHVSSFPGDDPRACERQMLYELMAFAHSEPLPQRVYAAGAAGIGIEKWSTDLLDLDGRLLSAPSSAAHGIGFEDADHWLTGSPDIVVLPKFWNRPLVIEQKGEKIERVQEMRALTRSYWPKHARQCRGYVGMGNRISQQIWPAAVVCSETWRLALIGDPNPDTGEIDDVSFMCRDHGEPLVPGSCLVRIDLEPIKDGVLLYSARDNPEVRASFYFEHDEQWFAKGLAALRRVQDHYAHDCLPPHPFGGKQWSAQPCGYCNHKKNTCKPDHQAGVTTLTESHGVEWSRGVFGHYDPAEVRRAVLERWRGREGYSYTLPPGYEAGRYGVQRTRERDAIHT